ncbi:MAG: YjbQ family protein [Phycisphaerales bacterium]|nr:MAG: YjbQ family protein [Phycisphaerales bacterium]
MPSHIKAALTATNLSLPITEGRLQLGPWQGANLRAHRRFGSARRLLADVGP